MTPYGILMISSTRMIICMISSKWWWINFEKKYVFQFYKENQSTYICNCIQLLNAMSMWPGSFWKSEMFQSKWKGGQVWLLFCFLSISWTFFGEFTLGTLCLLELGKDLTDFVLALLEFVYIPQCSVFRVNNGISCYFQLNVLSLFRQRAMISSTNDKRTQFLFYSRAHLCAHQFSYFLRRIHHLNCLFRSLLFGKIMKMIDALMKSPLKLVVSKMPLRLRLPALPFHSFPLQNPSLKFPFFPFLKANTG